jgi:hypothetical protein
LAVELFIKSKLEKCAIYGIENELKLAKEQLIKQNNNSVEIKEWLRQIFAKKPSLTKMESSLYLQKCNILVRGPKLGTEYSQTPHIDSPVSNLILLLPDFVYGPMYTFWCIPSSHLMGHDVKSDRMIETKLPLKLMKDVGVKWGQALLFFENLIHGGKGTSNGSNSNMLKEFSYWGAYSKPRTWFPCRSSDLPTDVSFQFTFGVRSSESTAFDAGAGHNYWYHNTVATCKTENDCGTCEYCVKYRCWKEKLDKLEKAADPHSLHNQKKHWYNYLQGRPMKRNMTRGRDGRDISSCHY